MNRRHFATTVGLGALAGGVRAFARDGDTEEEVIDIHQHVNFSGRGNEAFVAHQRNLGVTKTVLLPAGSALQRTSTHEGKSNGLAARIFGTAAAARLAAEHPGAFVYFCNEVPDAEGAVKELERWLEAGAVGIGELKFNLACDSAPMIAVYEVAQAYQVPVLLHIEHGRYNTGFERFHHVLERFPEVNFFGHAQTWWGNIDADHDQAVMYPEGAVTPGGLTDRYLADYPNMFGDLSAGSGKNALERDEEHAAAFLLRHQEKLCLGTDCSDSEGTGEGCSGSQQIANVRRLVPDATARVKILGGNARRLIRMS